MLPQSKMCFQIVAVGALSVAVSSCGVRAPDSGGDKNLPNAGAGPFRVLHTGEMPPKDRIIPYALRRKGTSDPCAVDADGDPATPNVRLYVAASPKDNPTAAPDSILLFSAADGRSFDPKTQDAIVLTPTESWEGGIVGAPSVLRAGSEFRLYYAAAGGIGAARSSDGVTFSKIPGPVLAPDVASSWEIGEMPGEPSVVQLDDGSFRMFYVAGQSIGEARSSDGWAWERIPGGPVLAPVAPPDFPTPDADTVYEPIDDQRVAGPHAMLATTSLGRRVLRLYYAGQNRIGLWSLGLAARYGFDGPLERAYSGVLGNAYAPKGPSVIAFEGFSLAYFTAPEDKSKPQSASAVAVGVAPATISLELSASP